MGYGRRTSDDSPRDALAKSAQSKQSKSVFENLSDHLIEIATSQFSKIRISNDLKASGTTAWKS